MEVAGFAPKAKLHADSKVTTHTLVHVFPTNFKSNIGGKLKTYIDKPKIARLAPNIALCDIILFPMTG